MAIGKHTKKNEPHGSGMSLFIVAAVLGLLSLIAIPVFRQVYASMPFPQWSSNPIIEPTKINPTNTASSTSTSVVPVTTNTATSTSAPCVEPVEAILVGKLKLYIHCGVINPQEIQKVLAYSASINSVEGDYHVFAEDDVQSADEQVLKWMTDHNSTDDPDFGDGGGRAFPGLVVFYQGKLWGEQFWGLNMDKYLIAHEYEHLVQYDLSGASNGAFPAWFDEGFAYLLAEQKIISLEGHSDYYPRDCFTIPPLPEVSNWGTVKNSECVYEAGYAAAEEMLESKGIEGYYSLLQAMKDGKSFADAFDTVYDISLADYYSGIPLPTP